MTVDNSSITETVTAVETLVRDAGDKITAGAMKYGPDILSTAESYIRVLSLIEFGKYFIGCIPMLIILYFSVKYMIKSCRADDFEEIQIFALFWVILGSSALLSFFLWNMADTDTILGIISPKLELIKMSKDALTQHIVGK